MTLKNFACACLAAGMAARVHAQTLTITNGVQTYGALTNFTVTLSNRCELHVTAATNPVPGCVINLNSSDAWFFLPNIRPSIFSANYLSQVFVNGAAAVAGGNCRVDQYAMGTVIVPQPPSYTPLQVFSGQNFLGASTNLGTYTYYTGAALGALRWNISSFRLKRGYSATFAQFQNGSGASKVYVAQDSDLEVGALPANLDHQCDFVRVFPWRWAAKRGWADTAGLSGDGALMKPYWFYDWGNGGGSSTDAEYIPMQWGGGYSTGINSKQKSTEVIGYNEPDSTAQANLSVAQAIANWPYMAQSGLRLGAPAVSDSGTTGTGLDWIYSFMNQATNLGYRVDFIPIHWYKCGQTPAQLLSYLTGVYQATGKPIWLTEFNYGANWCDVNGSQPPTPAQEASEVSGFISVLESAPFVERYSIYNWVTTNREMVLDDGVTVTPAGVVYRDTPTSMAYVQLLPPGGSRSLCQLRFETNMLDSSGYANNAFAIGAPAYTAGHSGSAVVLDGAATFLQLPPNIANSTNFTFAAWVYWNGGAQWQRIFDFGDDTSHYLFLTPNSGNGTLRFAINNGSGEQIIETSVLPSGSWQHVAVTLSGSSAKLYVNGTLATSSTSFTIAPSSFYPNLNYLGKSQFATDPLFHGNLDEVQIADYAMTAGQIAALLTNNPPQFTTNILSGGTAPQGAAYSGSIAGTATDIDPGDTLTYSKAGGLAWLNVAADGTLSGTPGPADGGTNNFTVRVTDAAGASAYAMLTIITPFVTGNSVWYVDGAGNWSDPTKWTHACPAGGAGLTADFSVLDITADRTVTLDSSRSLGALKFQDIAGSQAWTIASSGGSVLTLDTASAASPSIVVGYTPTLATSNGVTISASLAGTNGFSKSGWGTLFLGGGNLLSGTLNIDTGSTTASDGVVRLTSANAGTNLTAINIRNNNGGSSTLQLAGGGVVPAAVTLNGRTTNVAAIENISGSNLLSGGLSINVGGGYYLFQSDAGTLNLGGIVASAAGGTRNFSFQGAGDFFISGSIQNGSATTINVTKLDSGNLIFSGTNTFTGGMNVGGGAVKVSYARALETILVNLACAGSNALKFGPINGASVGALAGLNDVWLTNSSLGSVTLTNGGNNASSEYDGSLKGTGGLVKTGSGTLTLGGTNIYTGATTISAGAVRFGAGTNFIASLQPVLWMSFDQAGNGVVTNQGKGGWLMNGTLVGSGAYITNSGRFGNALYIDGNGGTAATNIVQINSKVADTSASSSWTMGYWIKTTTAGAVIMYQGDGGWSSSGQTTYLLNANSGGTAGTTAGAVRWAGGFLTGSTALNDGNWHFIALVDSAGTESIYVDGALDSVSSTMSLALASDANQMWIGGAPDTDTGAVKISGLIDEVCVFDRALTQAQIRGIVTNAPVSGQLPSASPVSLASGATLDLSGFPQSLASLTDANGGGGIITNASSAPVTLTLSNNTTSVATFSGRIADASAANAISILKSGSATQVLSGNYSYRGTTTVSNGTLNVNGSLGTNTVSVRGGILAGNGTISGAVTVYPSGILAPGSNTVGVLTINNSLALGGISFIEINKAALTNDVILGVSSLTYGGILDVVNLGGTLAAGDSFRIFYATNYNNSSFATANLPPLGTGLAWSTTNLTVNGSLSVFAAATPRFSAIAPAGDGNFIFNGTGAAGVNYELDAATNLMLPISWSFVTNAVADQTGLFQLIDLSATNFPQRFYRVMSSQ